MPEAWYPGATRYQVGEPGSYTGGPAKCTLHVTVNDPEQTSAMDVAEWMADNKPGSVYHVLYHPLSGECVQMLPVSGSAKALSNPSGGVETNKRGRVHIQISVVANVKPPFTDYPLPGWSKLLEWVDSWDIPRTWYANPPTGKVDHVSTGVWNETSGWCGHANVPENDHSDPGAIDLGVLFAGKGSTAPPPVEQPPASDLGDFKLGFDGGGEMGLRYLKYQNPLIVGGDVKSVQILINTKGLGNAGAVDGKFGSKTRDALITAQKALGVTADGVYGPKTAEKLIER